MSTGLKAVHNKAGIRLPGKRQPLAADLKSSSASKREARIGIGRAPLAGRGYT